MISEKQFRQTQ